MPPPATFDIDALQGSPNFRPPDLTWPILAIGIASTTGSLPPPTAPTASQGPAHSSISPRLPPIPTAARCCPGHLRVLPCPCPRCGARMIAIETFARGCEPKWMPTPNSIDTSRARHLASVAAFPVRFAGSPPAAISLDQIASIKSLRYSADLPYLQTHKSTSRLPSSWAPALNPHSARCLAGAQLPATSCLGAFLDAGQFSVRSLSCRRRPKISTGAEVGRFIRSLRRPRHCHWLAFNQSTPSACLRVVSSCLLPQFSRMPLNLSCVA